MARDLATHLIDLSVPNGITDRMSGGALYKWTRNVHSLYEYYRATGDEAAREAILKALDYNYRFNMISPPFGSTNHAAFLYTIAYRWTGRRAYLRLVNHLVESGLATKRLPGGVHTCAHPTMGVPTALGLLAEVEEPIEPFPVVSFTQADKPCVIAFGKDAGRPVEMSVYVRLSSDVDKDARAAVEVASADTEGQRRVRRVSVDEQRAFRSAQPVSGGRERDRHLHLRLSGEEPAGRYLLTFPNASRIIVLESSAGETGRYTRPESGSHR
jgi:hypothetical protein